MRIIDKLKAIENALNDKNHKINFKVVFADGHIETVGFNDIIERVNRSDGAESQVVMLTAADIRNKEDVELANLINLFFGGKTNEN